MLKPRITARQLIWINAFLLMLTILMMTWSTLRQQESTLAIRAVNQGASMPDGFSVLHHLDANGIHFKSITPKNDMLLITFDSPAQSAAAKQCLIKRYHTVMSSLSRTMTTKRYSGCPAYGKAHTALANLQESESYHSLW